MAKALSKSTPIKITIGLLIVVGLAIAAMSAGWVDHNSDIEAIGVKADTIKVEGCDPAKQAHTDIQVINVKLDGLKEDIDDARTERKEDFDVLRTEQRADKQEILTAIKESK